MKKFLAWAWLGSLGAVAVIIFIYLYQIYTEFMRTIINAFFTAIGIVIVIAITVVAIETINDD